MISRPLDGVDVRVDVADLHAEVLQVVGQVLGHLLGERRDEHAVAAGDALAHLAEEVVDLMAGGPHDDLRVHEAGRPDELLDHAALCLLELPRRPGVADT